MYNNKTKNRSVLTDGHLKYIKTAVSTKNGNLLPGQTMPSLQPVCIGDSGKIRRISSHCYFLQNKTQNIFPNNLPTALLYCTCEHERLDSAKRILTLRRLMSYIYIYIYIYIYMEHPFLMFLDHTQRRNTVGRTPLDE